MSAEREDSFLVVGGGGIGEKHIGAIRKAGVQRIGVVEPREDRQAELVGHYGLEAAWSNLEGADLTRYSHAVVASPPKQHLQHSRQLVKAGIHVLCEKPLAADQNQADEFERLDLESEAVIRIGYTRRAVLTESPILGPEGNKEFLIAAARDGARG